MVANNESPGLLAGAVRTAGFDMSLLRRYPKLQVALWVALCLPALYALIYLSSMWDPASHTDALRVALVNEDQGAEFQSRRVDLGAQIVAALQAQPQFGYVVTADAESARHAVRTGKFAFAILIPRDFSRLAVPGELAGAGKLVIYTSEGNNYAGAGFARSFAPELARRANQALNQQRWAVVLEAAASSAGGIDTLRKGIQVVQQNATDLAAGADQARVAAGALAVGSRKLAAGSDKLRSGLQALEPVGQQFVSGARQTRDSVQAMAERLPPATELRTLRSGAGDVASGHQDLGRSLHLLGERAAQLRDGSRLLAENSESLPFVGERIAGAAQQLTVGAEQLGHGLARAAAGSDRLSESAAQVSTAVAALTRGVAQVGSNLASLGTAMPADESLNSFAAGIGTAAAGGASLSVHAQRLAAGSQELDLGLEQLARGAAGLSDGLSLVADKVSVDAALPGGSPAGLSESVQPMVDVVAPVVNQGSGFAPNFIPLSLWVGATFCTFLFAYRSLPRMLATERTLALVLGKLAVPALVVCGQALLMLVMLVGVLGVKVDSMPRFVFTLLVTALAFLTLIFALVRIFGDAGKLIALVLLVLQLAAAGATMPIELTTPFFQAIHPYLPMTWVVRTLRIAMFGAFEGAWASSAAVIAAVSVACITLATWLGRWRLVNAEDYRPQIESD